MYILFELVCWPEYSQIWQVLKKVVQFQKSATNLGISDLSLSSN